MKNLKNILILLDNLSKTQPAFEDKLRNRLVKSENLLAKAPPTKATNILNRNMIPEKWANHYPEAVEGFDLNQNFDMSKGVTGGVSALNHSEKGKGQIIVKPPLNDGDFANIIKRQKHSLGEPLDNISTEHLKEFTNPNFTTAHREAMYKLLADQVFNMGHFVPPTTLFKHPKDGRIWSAQKRVSGGHEKNADYWGKMGRGSDDFHRIAIMDAALGNNDRMVSNLMLDNYGHPQLIDHALAFDYEHHIGIPIPPYTQHFLRNKLSSRTHAWIHNLDTNKLKSLMVSHGAPEHLANIAVRRINQLKDWSRFVGTNPREHAHNLGDALAVTHFHKLHDTPEISNERWKWAKGALRNGQEVFSEPDLENLRTKITRK